MTKLGDFLEVLGNKFSIKSSPNVWWLLGNLENNHFLSRTAVEIFWATFEKLDKFLGNFLFQHLVTVTKQLRVTLTVSWSRATKKNCLITGSVFLHLLSRHQRPLASILEVGHSAAKITVEELSVTVVDLLVTVSVNRFDDISPLWQNLNVFGNF